MTDKKHRDSNEIIQKIHRSDVSSKDLRELYELIGDEMQESHGVATHENPCSVESVTAAVVEMAKRLEPCPILNVGMGGYPLLDIELLKRGFKVTGIEYAFSLAQLAAASFRAAGFAESKCFVGDGAHLPIADESFEVAICSETVEHIPDDSAVIKEISRVLKPGGTLIFTVPCILALNDLSRRMMCRLRGQSLISHPTHLREYTYQSAKKLINPYFRIDAWYPVGFTTKSFRQMPVESLLSKMTALPVMKNFSMCIAFVLKKRES